MRLSATLVLLALAVPGVGQAQGTRSCTPTDATRRIEARLQSVVDSIQRSAPAVPGITLSVVAPRLCLDWHGAAGVADRATKAPLSARHPTRIASNTKTYTAAAILRLMEMGKLSLDDPVTKHVPAADLASLRRDGYDLD
nr:beta-lactamase family protein [Gemmatimonadaceae bacterium]